MISVIIPTIWKSPNTFYKLLSQYENSDYISEIIIIDNSPGDLKFDIFQFSKVKYFPQENNILVNPAWNLGVSYIEKDNYILLSNDDIIIEKINIIFDKFLNSHFKILGIAPSNKTGTVQLHSIDKFPYNSYGAFLLLKEYKVIPNDLLIWAGDNYLFNKISPRCIVNGVVFKNNSTSVKFLDKTSREFNKRKFIDKELYNKKYDN